MPNYSQTPLPPPLVEPVEAPAPTITAVVELLLDAVSFQARHVAQHWLHTQASLPVEVSTAEEVLTVEQTADLFDVVPQTIRDWTKRQWLCSYKLGHRVYYKRSEVLAALQAHNSPQRQRRYARPSMQPKAR